MNSEVKYIEINGNQYRLSVREDDNYREVQAGSPTTGVRAESTEKGGFGRSLRDRQSHISDVITEAVSKNEQRQSESDEMKREMEMVLESAKEVWEE